VSGRKYGGDRGILTRTIRGQELASELDTALSGGGAPAHATPSAAASAVRAAATRAAAAANTSSQSGTSMMPAPEIHVSNAASRTPSPYKSASGVSPMTPETSQPATSPKAAAKGACERARACAWGGLQSVRTYAEGWGGGGVERAFVHRVLSPLTLALEHAVQLHSLTYSLSSSVSQVTRERGTRTHLGLQSLREAFGRRSDVAQARQARRQVSQRVLHKLVCVLHK
jgi:hypothetical protein